MDRYLTILIFFVLCFGVNAQDTLPKPSTKIDIERLATNDSSTREEFRQILNLQFSKIITGNTFSNIGNYASIKTTDESLSLSASFLRENGDIISIEASGGASEGVAGFFNNGDLNTNISGTITYHIMFNPFGDTTIKRNSFERQKLGEELIKAEQTYIADTLATFHKKELLDTKAKITKAKKKEKGIKDKLLEVQKSLKLKETERLLFQQDSLLYEQDKVALDIRALEEHQSKIDNDEYFEDKFFLVREKYDAAVIENNKKVINQAVSGINIYWISLGYGIRNDGFKLFDSSLAFADQIQKEEALTHQFNAAISHYNWESFSSTDTYWSTGASFKLGNNLSSLDNIKVKDFEEVSTNPNRESFSEQSVFVGNFEDELSELKLFIDYYKFFKTTSDRNFALHLNPSFTARENNKPITSLWTGIVLPFRKSDDTSSFVNLEVFYSFNDLFNTSDSDDSLVGRNTIGLSATFPINFFKPKTD